MSFVQWTPRGATIVFSDRASLYAVAADGSRMWQVAKQGVWGSRSDVPVGTMTAFSIAPDGTQVVYSTCRYPNPEVAARREAAGERLEPEDYEYELVRVPIGGTGHQRLTENRIVDNHPAWSPDGRRIAFLAGSFGGYPDYAVKPKLFTMAPDGSDRQQLRTGLLAGIAPVPPQWSPDGTRLAFTSDGGTVFTFALGATRAQRLTHAVSGLSWSPDGQRIAFAKPDGDEVALYTVAVDGTNAQRVTAIEGWRPEVENRMPSSLHSEITPSWAFVETVAWSPSGEHILYSCGSTICVVNVDGTPVGQAPHAPGHRSDRLRQGVLAAAWAPDGSRIALSNVEGGGPILYTMAPDGTAVRVLVSMGDFGLMAGPVSAEDAVNTRRACEAGNVVPDPAENPELVRDCQTLVDVRGVLFRGRRMNWGASTPIDQWIGVRVDGAPLRVTGLTLAGSGWRTGAAGRPIPAKLDQLAQLRTLILKDDQLTGAIPPTLTQLVNLRELDLGGNQLTGSIPQTLGQLVDLRELRLGGNQLTGSIPQTLGQLAQLRVLELHGNQLTGTIPPPFAKLVKLRELVLAGNQLTGAIPPGFGQLVQLRTLNLRANQLTGAIPPEFGQLAQLTFLDLDSNQLTGPIPPELGRLARLTFLLLNSNQLTGAIPPELGHLVNLWRLDLKGNQLTGAIPPELGQLVNLSRLDLSDNRLTGSISPEFIHMVNLDVLALGSNQLTGCIPPVLQWVRAHDLSSLALPDCEQE